jgi:hypothetical protein
MPRGEKPRNPKLPKAGEPGHDTQRHHSMPMTRLRREIYRGLLAHMQPNEIQELIEILEKRKALDEDVGRVIDAAIRRRSGRSG